MFYLLFRPEDAITINQMPVLAGLGHKANGHTSKSNVNGYLIS